MVLVWTDKGAVPLHHHCIMLPCVEFRDIKGVLGADSVGFFKDREMLFCTIDMC